MEFKTKLRRKIQNEKIWQEFLADNILVLRNTYGEVLEKESVTLRGKYPEGGVDCQRRPDFCSAAMMRRESVNSVLPPDTQKITHRELHTLVAQDAVGSG